MKDNNCIFCKLANGEIPTATIYEDEDFRVILDANPAAKGHALILPKEHYANLYELDDELAGKSMILAKKMITKLTKALDCDGYNIVQNNGEAAGQTVSTGSYGSAEDEDSNYDKEVLEAADKLKEGQVSGVIETETGYYVIRLDKEFDEEATNEKKEELISQKQEDYYTDIVDGWKDNAAWEINEKEWAKVTFTDHFTAVAEDTETESIEDTEVQ